MVKNTLGMLRFFFIAVPVFIVVYATAMAMLEIKDYLKRYE
jgi:hypothetical protein